MRVAPAVRRTLALTASAFFTAVLASAASAAPRPQLVPERGPERLIINGSEADLGEYPAQAAIFYSAGGDDYYQGCGGTLVSATQVLTAAHCVVDGDTGRTVPAAALLVGLGHVDLFEFFYDENAAHLHRVVSIDPNVSYNRFSQRNDAAILWLDGPADVADENIATLRVVANSEDSLWAPGVTAGIIGWGDTDADPNWDEFPDFLMEATVPVRSDADCGAAYGAEFDATTMVCAGAADPDNLSADTCQGDSGGPLLVDDAAAATVLAGIVSWGYGCNEEGFPGVYSRLGDDPLNTWVHSRLGLGPPDLVPPVMILGPVGLRLTRAGRIPIRLTCSAAEPRGCAGTVTVSTRFRVSTPTGSRKVTFGRVAFDIPGGVTAIVFVNPSPRNDALIRRLRSVAVKVFVYAIDDAGLVATQTRFRTLRPIR